MRLKNPQIHERTNEMEANFEDLISAYLKGEMTDEEKLYFNDLVNSSEENQLIFKDAQRVNKSLKLLEEMKKYDPQNAINKVHYKIKTVETSITKKLVIYWQRAAAILLIPIIIGALLYVDSTKKQNESLVSWQTITTPPGIKSQTVLPDGTKVWLNSGSSLKYPSIFNSKYRNVELSGEAFFDVHEDKRHPFIVDMGKINVRVLGTEFNVINYQQEERTEVILRSGKVRLTEDAKGKDKFLTDLVPGERAIYYKDDNRININEVNVEKFTSWIDGKLVFKDDPISDVIRRLNHWYNVEIIIADDEILDYQYTATFQHETIDMVLNLFQKTSPIEYQFISSESSNKNINTRQKIVIKKKN